MVEISVIIPAYNAIEFLNESLDSIINQSFKDIEIICVDDGSTDDTLERLEAYASKDNRIQVYHQENQGPGGATNTGLSKAKGKYIYFMDADDVLDLNALKELHDIIEEKDLDFVIFKSINYDEESDRFYENTYHSMPELYDCVGDSVFSWRDIGDMIFKISVTPWSKLYKNELIRESGAKFPLNIIYQDNIFFWQILFNSNRIYFYDKVLYTRRVHPDSLVHSNNEKNVDMIKIYNLVFQTFIDYGHFEEFKVELYNRKIYLCNYRYKLIKDEFKELFFIEMKKDFEKIIGHEKYDDFYSNLYSGNKSLFDNVIKTNNHIEYDLINELSYLKNDHAKLINDNAKLKNDKKLLESDNLKLKNDKKLLESDNLKLKNEVKSLKNENRILNNEFNDVKKFNKKLLSSNSWKLTKPFRAFMNLLRKL